MKSSKLLMTVFVAMLILSLTITTVGAQTGLPREGEVDEDGELVEEIAPKTLPGVRGERLDISGYTIKYGDAITPDGTVMTEGTPYSPVSENIFSKTPKFWFTKTAGATMYKIQLRYWWSSDLVYTFKGAGDCNDVPGYCWLKPDIPLKTYEYFNWDNGGYMWSVGAKVGDNWYYSGYYVFAVLSKGFNSTFDTNLKKWYSITGDWFRVDPGYLKTPGLYNTYASAMQKEYFIDDYTFSARVKGKTGANQFQGVIIGGYPDPLWGGNIWFDGLIFVYSGGYTGVVFLKDGTQTAWTGWRESTNTDPTGWNTLEVVVDSPDADFYVNGGREWGVAGYADYVEPGYVGLTHVKYTGEKAPLLVDWAKLSYNPISAAEKPLDLSGARVIDLNNLPLTTLQGGGPLDPPQ